MEQGSSNDHRRCMSLNQHCFAFALFLLFIYTIFPWSWVEWNGHGLIPHYYFLLRLFPLICLSVSFSFFGCVLVLFTIRITSFFIFFFFFVRLWARGTYHRDKQEIVCILHGSLVYVSLSFSLFHSIR